MLVSELKKQVLKYVINIDLVFLSCNVVRLLYFSSSNWNVWEIDPISIRNNLVSLIIRFPCGLLRMFQLNCVHYVKHEAEQHQCCWNSCCSNRADSHIFSAIRSVNVVHSTLNL